VQQAAVFYDVTLTAAEAKKIYDLGISSLIEPVSTRISNTIAQSPFPPTLTNIDSNLDVYVDELPVSATPMLPEIQKLVDSELGALFVNSSGVLTAVGDQFYARGRSAVSQASFVDTSTGVYYDSSSIKFQFDADQIRNSATVTASFGQVAETSSSVSSSTYGMAAQSVDTRLAYLSDAETFANQIIAIYKYPKLSVEPFMVKGQRNPSYDWPRLLSLELLDRFTFIRTPSTGSAITQDMLLQSIEHRISPGTWDTVVNVSDRFTVWFIIGTSLIGGTDVLL
jgi:hypothetical protein